MEKPQAFRGCALLVRSSKWNTYIYIYICMSKDKQEAMSCIQFGLHLILGINVS